MYCPKCGAQAADETKYCRACGQGLTLVSQAMTKSLPVDDGDQQELEKAIKNIFLGTGFLIVSIVAGILLPEPGNFAFCIAMLIAAMVPLSIGVAEILGKAISRSRSMSSLVGRATAPETAPLLSEPPSGGGAVDPLERMPPSGVTEVTTRNLGVGAEHLRGK
ncbi:MAG: zinc-ribbon domain-containing protein [Blastocatellia bacterium]